MSYNKFLSISLQNGMYIPFIVHYNVNCIYVYRKKLNIIQFSNLQLKLNHNTVVYVVFKVLSSYINDHNFKRFNFLY